jgi:hypothetical protein
MDWNAIGAVGEILGAIAVVATLFYLTKQIHQSTKVARANLSKDLFLTSREAIWDLAANPELTEIFAEIRGYEDLDETRRTMFFQSFFRLYEVVFTLHREGLVDDGIYESYLTMIRVFAASKHFDAYWSVTRRQFHSEFRAYVDEQRAMIGSEPIETGGVPESLPAEGD